MKSRTYRQEEQDEETGIYTGVNIVPRDKVAWKEGRRALRWTVPIVC